MNRPIPRGVIAALLLMLLSAAALAQGDIARHRACGVCGMDRKQYGYSRMLVALEDGSELGTCSVQCVAEALGKPGGKAAKSYLVADRDSRELVDAEKAAWVMGGRKRGVMTAVPKWAFAGRDAAEAFVKAHGGKIVTWAEAFEAARKEAR